MVQKNEWAEIPAPPASGSDTLTWVRWGALMVVAVIGLWQATTTKQVTDQNKEAIQGMSAKIAKMDLSMTPAGKINR